jgi:hypothetical protein
VKEYFCSRIGMVKVDWSVEKRKRMVWRFLWMCLFLHKKKLFLKKTKQKTLRRLKKTPLFISPIIRRHAPLFLLFNLFLSYLLIIPPNLADSLIYFYMKSQSSKENSFIFYSFLNKVSEITFLHNKLQEKKTHKRYF